jgi:hypothetical protein
MRFCLEIGWDDFSNKGVPHGKKIWAKGGAVRAQRDAETQARYTPQQQEWQEGNKPKASGCDRPF